MHRRCLRRSEKCRPEQQPRHAAACCRAAAGRVMRSRDRVATLAQTSPRRWSRCTSSPAGNPTRRCTTGEARRAARTARQRASAFRSGSHVCHRSIEAAALLCEELMPHGVGVGRRLVREQTGPVLSTCAISVALRQVPETQRRPVKWLSIVEIGGGRLLQLWSVALVRHLFVGPRRHHAVDAEVGHGRARARGLGGTTSRA